MEERLQKVIARAGVTSRRKAEELILEGRVTVNGRAIRELGTKVDPSLDEVAVDTIPIPRTQAAGDGPKTYILLYKPRGVVCTVKDQHGRPTVLDLVPPFPGKRLYPVGRLDEDSEGIVLLTNDGELTAKLTHPRYGVPKVYEVRVKGHLTREDAAKVERGVWLSEGRTGRSRIFIDRAGRDVSHVRVTLTEGRNREIRRAFAKIEFPVLSIRRSQLGPIVGRGLESGQYRPLAPDEVEALHASAAGEGENRPLRKSAQHRRPGAEGAEAPPKPRRRPGKPDPALYARKRGPGGGFAAEGGRPGRTGWSDRGGRSSRGEPKGRTGERTGTGPKPGAPRGPRPGGGGRPDGHGGPRRPDGGGSGGHGGPRRGPGGPRRPGRPSSGGSRDGGGPRSGGRGPGGGSGGPRSGGRGPGGGGRGPGGGARGGRSGGRAPGGRR